MNKEIYDEVLDQLNKLTAQVKDLIENDTDAAEIFEEDGFVEKVVDNNETVSLYANGGYSSHVDLLANLRDTGNGYIMYIPTYNCTDQENYICMDYSEADYLRKMLNYIHRKDNK
jgi:hypothetical protein